MQVSKNTPLNLIEIWSPRYKDNTVLLAKFKVGSKNCIRFTKAKHLLNQEFYISGEDVKKSPLETNGRIACYAVPMDDLEPLERT